jgi:hypothetical protein
VNLLDENIPIDQRDILSAYGIPCRVIGVDLSYLGVGDENIISLLHHLKQPTLFTRDEHFFARSLCHERYCLVWLDSKPAESAEYARRFLAHPKFATNRNRMGVVARVHHDGIQFWGRGSMRVHRIGWSD